MILEYLYSEDMDVTLLDVIFRKTQTNHNYIVKEQRDKNGC